MLAARISPLRALRIDHARHTALKPALARRQAIAG